MSSRLRSSARHHVVALAGAAPRNAQLALLVWRGRRRASPLNRLSCPVLCVFSGYVLIHHYFCHHSFIISSSILIFFEFFLMASRSFAGLALRLYYFFLLLCCNQFCASLFLSISTTHPPGCQGKHLGHCMKCERPRPWPCALAFLDWDPRLCPRTGRGSRRFTLLAGIQPLLIACLGPGSGSR